MTEEWRSVVGHEGQYEVSSEGNVRSLDRVIVQRVGRGASPNRLVERRMRGQLLVLQPSTLGYLQVHLPGRGIVLVQYLVAESFIGPRPNGALVLHDDDIKTHNAPANLKYGTHLENQVDARKNERLLVGERRPNARISNRDASVIKSVPATIRSSEMAAVYGLACSRIGEIRHNRRWRDAPRIDPSVAAAEFQRRRSMHT